MSSIAQSTRERQYTDARQVGRADARSGQPCLPELYFAQAAQWVAYIRGYEAQMGVQTRLSRQAMRIAAAKIAAGVK